MRNRIADFCWRWLMVFGIVALAAYVASGLVMHYAVCRALWRWL